MQREVRAQQLQLVSGVALGRDAVEAGGDALDIVARGGEGTADTDEKVGYAENAEGG